MHTLISPLAVPKTKTKNFILNLNIYRNTHYQTLNKVKINYKTVMKNQIMKLPIFTKLSIEYTLYPKTKRLTDLENVISIHQKFFQDALVEFGRIEDDTYLHIVESIQRFGEVDKHNPRVEIHLFQIKET